METIFSWHHCRNHCPSLFVFSIWRKIAGKDLICLLFPFFRLPMQCKCINTVQYPPTTRSNQWTEFSPGRFHSIKSFTSSNAIKRFSQIDSIEKFDFLHLSFRWDCIRFRAHCQWPEEIPMGMLHRFFFVCLLFNIEMSERPRSSTHFMRNCGGITIICWFANCLSRISLKRWVTIVAVSMASVRDKINNIYLFGWCGPSIDVRLL